MNTQVHFAHMDRSEALESQVLDKIEPIVEEYAGQREQHLRVWLVADQSIKQKGARSYKCEISVRVPPRREIFISKSATDMYIALKSAAKSLRTTLREEFKRRIYRRNDLREQIAIQDSTVVTDLN